MNERPTISPAHAGALAARMLILEEDCREVERNLDGFRGILYEYAGEIPETIKRRMRLSLAAILDHVAAIRKELGLPKQVLENARPERMKGYGREFSPADKALWTNLIQGLLSDIKEMRRILVKGEVNG